MHAATNIQISQYKTLHVFDNWHMIFLEENVGLTTYIYTKNRHIVPSLCYSPVVR